MTRLNLFYVHTSYLALNGITMSSKTNTAKTYRVHIGRGNKIVKCQSSNCKVKGAHFNSMEEALAAQALSEIRQESSAQAAGVYFPTQATETRAPSYVVRSDPFGIDASEDLYYEESEVDIDWELNDEFDEAEDAMSMVCDHCEERNLTTKSRKDPYEEKAYGNLVWRPLCKDCFEDLKYN